MFFIFCKNKIQGKEEAIVIPALVIDKADTALHLINGVYYYRQQLFSGTVEDKYADGNTYHKTSFYNGKEEGWTLMYYPDGLLAEKRYYHLGEKDGLHSGWWQNGKLRFEYHFTGGLYNGDYKEWYNNGKAYKLIHYTNGKDDWGQGWRENGRLFMNYTMREGRRYGIVNSNLCYTLKNERGDFVGAKRTTNNNDQTINSDSKPR